MAHVTLDSNSCAHWINGSLNNKKADTGSSCVLTYYGINSVYKVVSS